MFAFDVATMVLDTEKVPQHTIAELNSSIVFISIILLLYYYYIISVEALQWKEIKTYPHPPTHPHTHTHTQHTHTHTHTHT